MKWIWLCLLIVTAAAQEEEAGLDPFSVGEGREEEGPEELVEQEEQEVYEFIDWDPEDVVDLANEKLFPGYYLLVLPKIATPDYFPELPDAPPELPNPGSYQLETDVDISWISPETMRTYFAEAPTTELVDPQGMLSEQAFQDRAAFLEYHRNDSDIPIFIYLFGGQQQVPHGYDIQSQLRTQLSDRQPVCLVYYFLGKPEKSEIALSPGLRDSLTLLEYQRILDSAVTEASEKSDAVDQLEGFSVQLSIRLYWLEKEMRENEGVKSPSVVAAEEEKRPRDTKSRWKVVEPYLGHATLASFIALVVLCGWIGRKISLSRRRYTFPNPADPARLLAPHGAGVGAVIRFSSTKEPPSAQREQTSDYMNRG